MRTPPDARADTRSDARAGTRDGRPAPDEPALAPTTSRRPVLAERYGFVAALFGLIVATVVVRYCTSR